MGAQTLQGDAIAGRRHSRVLLDPAQSNQFAMQPAQFSRRQSFDLGDTAVPGFTIDSTRLRIAFEQLKQHGIFKRIGFFKHASSPWNGSVRGTLSNRDGEGGPVGQASEALAKWRTRLLA